MKYLIILIILFTFISCEKYASVPPASHLVESDKVFTSESTALSAVVGMYNQMRTLNLNIINGGTTVYAGLSADEIYNTSSTHASNPFYINQLQPNNSIVGFNFWNKAYTNIYQANLIIEGLGKESSTIPTRNQLIGEAKLVRSLYYFYMVNLFGDVPLVLTTDYNINKLMPRTPTTEVYKQIVIDLEDAKQLLGHNYIITNRTRPNKYVACAILSKVYLYLKQWQNAEKEASEVINQPNLFELVTNLDNVFLINSKEVIWQLGSETTNTAEGATFNPSSASSVPTFAITPTLFSAFQGNDNRRTSWLRKNTVSGKDYYYPYKFKIRSSSTISEYIVLLRFAEQYLIRAEARAMQEKIMGSGGAEEDINKIRARAGLSGVVAANREDMIKAIMHERQCELFCEWGNRWFDLKRNSNATQVLSPLKSSNWQDSDTFYPIPEGEINLNSKLSQNPGY